MHGFSIAEKRLVWRAERCWHDALGDARIPAAASLEAVDAMLSDAAIRWRLEDGRARLLACGMQAAALLDPASWNLQPCFAGLAEACRDGELARLEAEVEQRRERMALRAIALPFGDGDRVSHVLIAANWRVILSRRDRDALAERLAAGLRPGLSAG